MKKILVIVTAAFLRSCNNDGNVSAKSDSSDRPRDPNKAVTNQTRLANDSVIVPDTNNVGVDPSSYEMN